MKRKTIPAVTGFELISWKTAAIPCFGRDEDDDDAEDELASEAGGGFGAEGALGLEDLAGAETVAPVSLHTGPKG